MILYQLLPSGNVYQTHYEAERRANEMKLTDYTIDKCKVVEMSAQNLVEIINSGGGCWCEYIIPDVGAVTEA